MLLEYNITNMNSRNVTGFIGSLLVMAIAISIFFMLMSTEMPASNRELLIAFVSVLFGAMSGSIKKITGDGDDNQFLRELENKNKELEQRIKDLTKEK
jgi:hypothetical protein